MLKFTSYLELFLGIDDDVPGGDEEVWHVSRHHADLDGVAGGLLALGHAQREVVPWKGSFNDTFRHSLMRTRMHTFLVRGCLLVSEAWVCSFHRRTRPATEF